jgi:hypothetical protein
MFELNFNAPYIGLDGKQIKLDPETETLNKIIGNTLVASNKGETLKFYDWAVKIYKGESIHVDAADLKKIRDFVDNHAEMYILCKAQLLKIIDEAKAK